MPPGKEIDWPSAPGEVLASGGLRGLLAASWSSGRAHPKRPLRRCVALVAGCIPHGRAGHRGADYESASSSGTGTTPTNVAGPGLFAVELPNCSSISARGANPRRPGTGEGLPVRGATSLATLVATNRHASRSAGDEARSPRPATAEFATTSSVRKSPCLRIAAGPKSLNTKKSIDGHRDSVSGAIVVGAAVQIAACCGKGRR